MDADQLEEQLLRVLRDTRHDDIFSGASAVDLVLMIRNGARQMVAQGRTSDADLLEASDQLRRFLSEMDAERVSLGLTAFQEGVVAAARDKLCPGFWPFC